MVPANAPMIPERYNTSVVAEPSLDVSFASFRFASGSVMILISHEEDFEHSLSSFCIFTCKNQALVFFV
jgi:hypothetical protein